MSEQDSNMPVVSDQSAGAFDLVMNDGAMERMMSAAKMMASAKVTIPKHLQNSQGDCMAVIMQAAQWKMNPFAVAQKTHLSQSGALGYESQLINAVIVGSGSIKGQPEFEFIGDWSKILGKVVEKAGQSGGKYFAANWDKKDEEGLGVIVTATLRGENEPRSLTIMLTQCYPRFSTQWATDPQQQITYLAVRKFSRRYCPGAILGCYDIEELDSPPAEREINPPPPKRQTGAQAAESARAKTTAPYTAEELASIKDKMEVIATNYGKEAYAEEWSKLSDHERKILVHSGEHERLKKVAESIVSTATEVVDTETGEVIDHE